MIDTGSLLRRVDLVALIGETVPLARHGAQHYGLCPFHQDRAPTLRIDGKKGLWHCPACLIGGDAIAWLRQHDGLSFRDACAELARRAGVDLARQEPKTEPARPRFPRPERRPATPWGGQHLLSGGPAAETRPVLVLDQFPGRARYLALAEQFPAVDLVWWPREGSTAAEMLLDPIATRPVRTEPWHGLAQAYRCAALIDAIAGWRLRWRGTVPAHWRDDLMLEAGRIEGWLAHFMQGREVAPGLDRAGGPGGTRERPAKEVTRMPASDTTGRRDEAA